MPGVNGICNPKMSQYPGNFELLLRQAVALRNFHMKMPRWGVLRRVKGAKAGKTEAAM